MTSDLNLDSDKKRWMLPLSYLDLTSRMIVEFKIHFSTHNSKKDKISSWLLFIVLDFPMGDLTFLAYQS